MVSFDLGRVYRPASLWTPLLASQRGGVRVHCVLGNVTVVCVLLLFLQQGAPLGRVAARAPHALQCLSRPQVRPVTWRLRRVPRGVGCLRAGGGCGRAFAAAAGGSRWGCLLFRAVMRCGGEMHVRVSRFTAFSGLGTLRVQPSCSRAEFARSIGGAVGGCRRNASAHMNSCR